MGTVRRGRIVCCFCRMRKLVVIFVRRGGGRNMGLAGNGGVRRGAGIAGCGRGLTARSVSFARMGTPGWRPRLIRMGRWRIFIGRIWGAIS